uniref:RING-type domain-containing protein n=1 Tax=Globisporangium ultimum (strain ATCC 200006 / CBS 805.95 / DAOM BR144) TaxID=431595 RepID=K3WN06_GLOUD
MAMGFRGVLLKLAEAEAESLKLFRVVAPDAQLALTLSTAAASHNALRGSQQNESLALAADETLLVTDVVSSRVLQVARCGSVSLQRETNSALWVAALPRQKTPLPQDHAGSGYVQQQQQPSATMVKRPMIAPWDPMIGHQIHGGTAQVTRICYCFQFRSSVEYEMFERTVHAYLRIQRMALLEKSVLMEVEIQYELDGAKKTKKKDVKDGIMHGDRNKVTPSPHNRALVSREQLHGSMNTSRPMSRTQGNAMSRSVQRNRTVSNVRSTAGQQVLRDLVTPTRGGGTLNRTAGASGGARGTSKVARAVLLDPNTICILCKTKQAQSIKQLSKHPFVLQDTKGHEVYICMVCMEQVLRRRVKHQGTLVLGAPVAVCGLCSETETSLGHALKKCAHPQCPCSYCTACLHKLVGKARTQSVWRTREWHCPNCTPFNTENSKAVRSNGPPSLTPGASSAATRSEVDDKIKRNRKRRLEITDENDSSQSVASPNEMVMASVDYAANYFQFLMNREHSKVPPEDESEDVCFCCKDGGELIECDWPGDDLKGAKCPKVYHEECLGYKVPENFLWKCPRHRCQTCGIIAKSSCRFCVTSYCADHVPEGVKRAVAQGTLAAKTHALIFRSPPKRVVK